MKALRSPVIALAHPTTCRPSRPWVTSTKLLNLSDIYSLGAVLYELLTRKRPYEGSSGIEAVAKTIAEPPEPVGALEPAAPVELAAICEHAMERKRQDRYQSAKELANEIQRFLAGGLVQAHEYRLVEHLRRLFRRHKAVVLTAVLALMILLVTAGIAYMNILQARDREREQRLAAEAANEQLLWENYAATLGMVQKRLSDGAYPRARELLYRSPKKHRGWEWGRLVRQATVDLLTLNVDDVPDMPPGSTHKVVFSPDNRYLLMDRPGFLTKSLFDLQTGKTAAPTERYSGWREVTAFMPNGRDITVGIGYRAAAIMNPFTGEIVQRFDVETGILRTFTVSPDGRLAAGLHIDSAAKTRDIVLWERASGKEIRRFPLETNWAGRVLFRWPPDLLRPRPNWRRPL